MANGGADSVPPAAAAEAENGERRSVLVTGGAGFIGTHTVLQLLKKGYDVTVVDNFHNSVPEALERVRQLAGPALSARLEFIPGDLKSEEDLEKVFAAKRYEAVVHFAGLKAVAESVAHPEMYYENNMGGTMNLYAVMKKYGCKKMVFSSSATVYGQPKKIPCVEDSDLKALNPYGRTKLCLEEMAEDYHNADPEWRIILLRYFNPIGAHESGEIGEDPEGIPNNLLPYIQQVAVGRLPELNVYGYDYRTRDGTAVVWHTISAQGVERTTVLEILEASGKVIPIEKCPRRPGDSEEV